MAMGLYKSGQGYHVRVVSGIALGVIVLMGAKWVSDLLVNAKVGGLEPIFVQSGGAVIFTAVLGIIGFWLIGRKPRSVDFLVACETEMKKVNWSTRREVFGSTWVVILLTVFTAAFCFAWDFVFQLAFKTMGVLETVESAL